MRFYKSFPEAVNEIRRELKEMGVMIHTTSVQNLDITNNPDFNSLELQNYTYTIIKPDVNEIPLKNPEWAEREFLDRISGKPINPGETYKLRMNTWGPLLNAFDQFDYTYPERLSLTLEPVIKALKQDLYTRRAYVGVFDIEMDDPSNFRTRIPCTLGYWFNYRQDRLNITYLLRSSDFSEHFNYDIYLAIRLLNHVAGILDVQPGSFTHWIGSFHVFSKDVDDAF